MKKILNTTKLIINYNLYIYFKYFIIFIEIITSKIYFYTSINNNVIFYKTIIFL